MLAVVLVGDDDVAIGRCEEKCNAEWNCTSNNRNKIMIILTHYAHYPLEKTSRSNFEMTILTTIVQDV